MNVQELVAGLRARGVRLTPSGEKLRYEAPPGVLTPDDLEALRQHKPEILSRLRRLTEPARPPDYAATACVCLVPIGGTGPDRCGVCDLPLICPHCGWCRGCKLRLRFPPGGEPYG